MMKLGLFFILFLNCFNTALAEEYDFTKIKLKSKQNLYSEFDLHLGTYDSFFHLDNFAFEDIINLMAPGGDAGNGGGSYVCRNEKQTIFFAETVDLWEGENVHGLGIPKHNRTSAKRQAIRALGRLYKIFPYFAQHVSLALERVFTKVQAKVKAGDKNIVLAVIDDSIDIVRPQYCPDSLIRPNYEQTINYLNNDELKLDVEIYNALATNTDRAALLLHEAIYYVLRKSQGDTDSRNTRILVANAFSTFSDAAVKARMVKTITGKPFTKSYLKKTQRQELKSRIRSCDFEGLLKIFNSPIGYYNNEIFEARITESVWYNGYPDFSAAECKNNEISIIQLLDKYTDKTVRNDRLKVYLALVSRGGNTELVTSLLDKIEGDIAVAYNSETEQFVFDKDQCFGSAKYDNENYCMDIFAMPALYKQQNFELLRMLISNADIKIMNPTMFIKALVYMANEQRYGLLRDALFAHEEELSEVIHQVSDHLLMQLRSSIIESGFHPDYFVLTQLILNLYPKDVT